MNTPITDAFAIKIKTPCGEKYWVPVDIARKLESERDEARATCSELVTDSDAITLARTVVRITQERNEARGQRDRLAEALERIRDYQGLFAEDDPQSVAAEALQSLTPNTKP